MNDFDKTFEKLKAVQLKKEMRLRRLFDEGKYSSLKESLDEGKYSTLKALLDAKNLAFWTGAVWLARNLRDGKTVDEIIEAQLQLEGDFYS